VSKVMSKFRKARDYDDDDFLDKEYDKKKVRKKDQRKLKYYDDYESYYGSRQSAKTQKYRY